MAPIAPGILVVSRDKRQGRQGERRGSKRDQPTLVWSSLFQHARVRVPKHRAMRNGYAAARRELRTEGLTSKQYSATRFPASREGDPEIGSTDNESANQRLSCFRLRRFEVKA